MPSCVLEERAQLLWPQIVERHKAAYDSVIIPYWRAAGQRFSKDVSEHIHVERTGGDGASTDFYTITACLPGFWERVNWSMMPHCCAIVLAHHWCFTAHGAIIPLLSDLVMELAWQCKYTKVELHLVPRSQSPVMDYWKNTFQAVEYQRFASRRTGHEIASIIADCVPVIEEK